MNYNDNNVSIHELTTEGKVLSRTISLLNSGIDHVLVKMFI